MSDMIEAQGGRRQAIRAWTDALKRYVASGALSSQGGR